MKYLLILFTTVLFSQNMKKDTLFVSLNKVNIENLGKKSFNGKMIIVRKQIYFDSLTLNLNKSCKSLKRKAHRDNTIEFNHFINMDLRSFINQMEKFVIFLIYDKKKYYEIKDFIYYDRTQE